MTSQTPTPTYIMAVPFEPQRAKRANNLRKATGGCIIWDQEQNAMHTFGLVLKAMIADGDVGSILLQDDIELANNWRALVEEEISEHLGEVVNFFSLSKTITESQYRPGKTYIMNQCVYLPPGYAFQLLHFIPEFLVRYPQFKTGDDFVIRYWLHSRRETFWLHAPSLVQHEGWASSINAKRPRNRLSASFDGSGDADGK